ncbi:MAG: hypothetical protein ACOCUY_01375 [Verrucomicrobiota bacterium]
MKYSITFWPPPNWQREGSLNPKFLAAVGAVAFFLVMLGVVGGLKADLAMAESERSSLEFKLDDIAPDVEEVRRQRGCTRFWEGALEAVEGITGNRILWSRQLEALARTIPESMVLSRINAQSSSETLPQDADSSKLERTGTRYNLQLEGEVQHARASSIIGQFSDEAQEAPGFAGLIEKIELSRESPLDFKKGPGKEFSLTVIYQIIDWEKVDNP